MLRYFLFYGLFIMLFSCRNEESTGKQIYFAASNYPVAFILSEITGSKDNVICPLKPGTSVHTFSPRPSDINLLQNAKAIFYISDKLDYWVRNIDNENKFELITLVKPSDLIYINHPHHDDHVEEGINIPDYHIWTDPVLIKSMVPQITKWLIDINPADSNLYLSNSKKLTEKLSSLDEEFRNSLIPYQGRKVFLFHPSFLYLLKRYNLSYAGSIEESPGKEPSIKYIHELRKKIETLDINALYTEPQLSEKSIMPIADGLNLKILLLDPLGGLPGRSNYFELMRFNVRNIIKGFN